MQAQKELFVVEREDGEWVDMQGDGGYSCFLSRAEAQDALDSEADNCEDGAENYKVVRFVRE
jgi:hypothetical protein